jgi:hypothetical protein
MNAQAHAVPPSLPQPPADPSGPPPTVPQQDGRPRPAKAASIDTREPAGRTRWTLAATTGRPGHIRTDYRERRRSRHRYGRRPYLPVLPPPQPCRGQHLSGQGRKSPQRMPQEVTGEVGRAGAGRPDSGRTARPSPVDCRGGTRWRAWHEGSSERLVPTARSGPDQAPWSRWQGR